MLDKQLIPLGSNHLPHNPLLLPSKYIFLCQLIWGLTLEEIKFGGFSEDYSFTEVARNGSLYHKRTKPTFDANNQN